jgi:hypothetical protein
VQERKRICIGDSARTVDNSKIVARGKCAPEQSLAPVWVEACFPVGSQTTEADLRELLKEAADSARDDYGPE